MDEENGINGRGDDEFDGGPYDDDGHGDSEPGHETYEGERYDEPMIGGGPGDEPPEYDPPESAAPSAYLYRGSLVALVLGSFVALYLVLNPPADDASVEPPREISTTTPALSETATATPEPAVEETPPSEGSPAGDGSPTPQASPTPEPSPSPADEDVIEYEVQPGETLSEIAQDFDVTVDEIVELNPSIDPDNVAIGDVILIPATE